jgi:3-oxoacyl-[acyl-carrier protein] reductase
MIYPTVTEHLRGGSGRRGAEPLASRRVALMTGSSRGLGRAIAHRLADDGLAVAIHDSNDGDGALELVSAIRRDGGVAGAFMEDVSDEEQAAELALAVAASLGFVEVLVLNATGMQVEAPRSDVGAVLRRALLPGMEVKGSGRIVKVDPEVVEPPVDGRSRGLVRELAPLGITVNTVTPRFAAPSADVAHAVSFVASEAAGSITGQRIVVDGGRGPVG